MDDKPITDLLALLDATAGTNEYHVRFFDFFAQKVMKEQDHGKLYKSVRSLNQQVISLALYKGLETDGQIAGVLVGNICTDPNMFRVRHIDVDEKMGNPHERLEFKVRLLSVLENYLLNYCRVTTLAMTLDNGNSLIPPLLRQFGFRTSAG